MKKRYKKEYTIREIKPGSKRVIQTKKIESRMIPSSIRSFTGSSSNSTFPNSPDTILPIINPPATYSHNNNACGSTKSSCITVCDIPREPTQPTEPHTIYPLPRKCFLNRTPTSPIVLGENQGPTLDVSGVVYHVKASDVDTNCQIELATATFPPGQSMPTFVNYSADIFLMVISGSVVVNCNSTLYTLSQGGSFM